MNKPIHPGDEIGCLDSDEKGIVLRVDGENVLIENQDGFETWHRLDKIVVYKSAKNIEEKPDKNIQPGQKKGKVNKNEFEGTKRIRKAKYKDFFVDPGLIGEGEAPKYKGPHSKKNVWEVDLHMEELMPDHGHLSNSEILKIQLDHARLILDKAMQQKVPYVVFIHGKGKGRLRDELITLLSGIECIEYYDASFKEYGGGAMEVKLFISKL